MVYDNGTRFWEDGVSPIGRVEWQRQRICDGRQASTGSLSEAYWEMRYAQIHSLLLLHLKDMYIIQVSKKKKKKKKKKRKEMNEATK